VKRRGSDSGKRKKSTTGEEKAPRRKRGSIGPRGKPKKGSPVLKEEERGAVKGRNTVLPPKEEKGRSVVFMDKKKETFYEKGLDPRKGERSKKGKKRRKTHRGKEKGSYQKSRPRKGERLLILSTPLNNTS